MKILLVSELFQPSNKIGSIRPTNIAQNLVKMNYNVTVITTNPESEKFILNNKLSILIVKKGKITNYLQKIIKTKIIKNRSKGIKPTEYKPINKKNNKNKIKNKIKNNLKIIILQIIQFIEALEWSRKIEKMFHKKYEFDVIISTYGPLSSYYVGKKLFKNKISNKWISDMRDPMCNPIFPKFINKIYEKNHFYMVKNATAVVNVSNAITEKFKRKYCKTKLDYSKLKTIPNGYQNLKITPLPNYDNVLRIAYTGALYSGRRDMSALFKIIKKISEINSKIKIQVHYAGNDHEILLNQAKNYEIEKCIINHGTISHEESIKLQEKCDILCVLSWNTKEEQGILTGKFLEYLGANRPIISLVSGNVPNAELSLLVKQMNVGFAYEYVSANIEDELFFSYIFKISELKSIKQKIQFSPDIKDIKKYDYFNITKKFVKIIERKI